MNTVFYTSMEVLNDYFNQTPDDLYLDNDNNQILWLMSSNISCQLRYSTVLKSVIPSSITIPRENYNYTKISCDSITMRLCDANYYLDLPLDNIYAFMTSGIDLRFQCEVLLSYDIYNTLVGMETLINKIHLEYKDYFEINTL